MWHGEGAWQHTALAGLGMCCPLTSEPRRPGGASLLPSPLQSGNSWARSSVTVFNMVQHSTGTIRSVVFGHRRTDASSSIRVLPP
ncbi:unnamed protein product [Protopolystoma xenopodis]|uniref:Uncharacterized protein n=1 Tax=Protopolystoma xenopodis TaxID=117903 RepID=A0A3S5C9L4_9PLAT|nr:unnamed protein product [Protopolystoma xenopodis]